MKQYLKLLSSSYLLRTEWLLILCLFFLSLMIRIYKIEPLLTFTYDQGRDMIVLSEIAKGDIKLIGPTTGMQGLFLGPLMYYLLLPGFIIGSGSPYAVVIWQIIITCLSYIFYYLILKKHLGVFFASLGYFWLIITPGAIEQSRSIWNPSLVVPILLPAIYFLFYHNRHYWKVFLSFFFLGLSLQTELAYSFFIVPVFGLYFLSQLNWKKLGLIDLKLIAVAGVAFILTLVPQIFFEIKYDFLMTNSTIAEINNPDKKVTLSYVWKTRPLQIYDALKNTVSGDTFLAEGLFYFVFVSLVVVLVTMRKDKVALFWVGYMTFPLLGVMFHTGNYGNFFSYYIVAHYLPMLSLLLLVVAKLKSPLWGLLITIFLVGNSIIFLMTAYNTGLFKYTLKSQILAIEHVRQVNVDNKPVLVFVPNLLPVTYEYLNTWLFANQSVEPLRLNVSKENDYYLMYEPPIDTASGFVFKQWHGEHIASAKCQEPVVFGITHVVFCSKIENQ